MKVTHEIQKITDISHLASIVVSNEDAVKLKVDYDRRIIEDSHVQGFRQGKAPLNVVIAKIGEDKYYKDLREHIASKALAEALKDEEINPVVTPEYEFADWEEGGKFVFTATIYTEPKDASEMFIRPDIDVPSPASEERYSEPIYGMPGQMPIIDGKLPPHLAERDRRPKPPVAQPQGPSRANIPDGDLTAPIHKMPERPGELPKTPDQAKESKKNDK